MLDHETWRFINSFAPWLSAVGTLSAVITSLYLARRNDPRLKLVVGKRTLIVPGQNLDEPAIYVEVVNVGGRSCTIDTIYWKTNPYRRNGLFWVPPVNSYSSPFPISLEDGKKAQYLMSLEEFSRNMHRHVSPKWKGTIGWLRSYFFRAYVSTSTGKQFKAKVEPELRKHLWDSVNVVPPTPIE